MKTSDSRMDIMRLAQVYRSGQARPIPPSTGHTLTMRYGLKLAWGRSSLHRVGLPHTASRQQANHLGVPMRNEPTGCSNRSFSGSLVSVDRGHPGYEWLSTATVPRARENKAAETDSLAEGEELGSNILSQDFCATSFRFAHLSSLHGNGAICARGHLECSSCPEKGRRMQ